MSNRIPWTLSNIIAVVASGGLFIGSATAQDGEGKFAKRGEALGFASHLTSDVDMAVGLRNFGELVNGLATSNFVEKIDAMAQSQGTPSFREDPSFLQIVGMLQMMVGKDAFIALGDGGAESMRVLGELNSVYSRIAMKGFAASFSGGLGGDPDMMRSLVVDEADAWLPVLERAAIPGILIGSRITEGLDDVLGQLRSMEGELPPQVVVSDIKVPGAGEFRLWSLELKNVVDDGMRQMLRDGVGDAGVAKRLEAIIDKKTVELAYGRLDDYLVISFGENHEHLKFADKPKASLVSVPEFDFVDQWLGKKLIGYSYTVDAVLGSLQNPDDARDIAEVAGEFLDDLQKKSGVDWLKVRGLVGKLGAQMAELSKAKYTTSVGVAMLDGGLRMESLGGIDNGSLDGDAPLKIAKGLPDDAFLKISAVAAPGYEEKSVEMLKTLGQTVYHAAKTVAGMDGMEEFGQQFGPMETLFLPDLLKIWNILETKYMAGLDREGSLVVDLKGSMPKLPQIPRVLANQGKVPRIAMVRSIKERSKLAEAWQELVPAINQLATKIPGQEPGAEFQVPDTLTSEKDGLTTHFFGLPFVSNDFLPSVSLNDELFFMSTSKNLSESVAAGVKEGKGETLKGMAVEVNFDALRSYAHGWLELVLENAKEVFGGNEFAAADFKENAGGMRFGLELSEVLHSLKINVRSEDGKPRASVHLKISDVPR